MFCASCGKGVSETSKFCSSCGAAVAISAGESAENVAASGAAATDSAVVSKFLARLVNGRIANRIFALGSIEQPRLDSAKKAYLKLDGEDEIVLVHYDDSVFGNGKLGFVITNKRLIAKLPKSYGGTVIDVERPLAEIDSLEIIKKKVSRDIAINGDVVANITQIESDEIEFANSQLAMVIASADAFSRVASSVRTDKSATGALVCENEQQGQKSSSGSTLLGIAAGVAVAVGVGWFLNGNGSFGEFSDIQAAEQIIKEGLNAPSSYKQLDGSVLWTGVDSEGNDAAMVMLDYEAMNGFGGIVRSCHVVSYIRVDGDLLWNTLFGVQECAGSFLPEQEMIALYREANFGI